MDLSVILACLKFQCNIMWKMQGNPGVRVSYLELSFMIVLPFSKLGMFLLLRLYLKIGVIINGRFCDIKLCKGVFSQFI